MAAGFRPSGCSSEVTEVVNGFATEKDPAAIRALWTELKRAYGDEATAVQAVLRQPQIINPSYTDPPAVISRSKAVLVEYMGEEESIEVMLCRLGSPRGALRSMRRSPPAMARWVLRPRPMRVICPTICVVQRGDAEVQGGWRRRAARRSTRRRRASTFLKVVALFGVLGQLGGKDMFGGGRRRTRSSRRRRRRSGRRRRRRRWRDLGDRRALGKSPLRLISTTGRRVAGADSQGRLFGIERLAFKR